MKKSPLLMGFALVATLGLAGCAEDTSEDEQFNDGTGTQEDVQTDDSGTTDDELQTEDPNTTDDGTGAGTGTEDTGTVN